MGKSPSEEADFFGPQYLKRYNRELGATRTAAEVAFAVRNLDLKKGARILDVGCGHGRHSLALAARGYRVTGIDTNRFLLESARREARRRKVKAEFALLDMRRMAFRGKYDAAICFYTSFGYSEKESDHLQSLRRISRALKPGGKFLLDVANRDYLIAHPRPWWFEEEPDGSLVCQERRFDYRTSVKTNRQIYVLPDGRRREITISVRMFAPHELAALCPAAGLRVREIWGDLGEDYRPDSRGILLLAEKAKLKA